ncbi:MAG: hypothetical protein Q9165_006993 [Trypethelium subeluteriae]
MYCGQDGAGQSFARIQPQTDERKLAAVHIDRVSDVKWVSNSSNFEVTAIEDSKSADPESSGLDYTEETTKSTENQTARHQESSTPVQETAMEDWTDADTSTDRSTHARHIIPQLDTHELVIDEEPEMPVERTAQSILEAGRKTQQEILEYAPRKDVSSHQRFQDSINRAVKTARSDRLPDEAIATLLRDTMSKLRVGNVHQYRRASLPF